MVIFRKRELPENLNANERNEVEVFEDVEQGGKSTNVCFYPKLTAFFPHFNVTLMSYSCKEAFL